MWSSFCKKRSLFIAIFNTQLYKRLISPSMKMECSSSYYIFRNEWIISENEFRLKQAYTRNSREISSCVIQITSKSLHFIKIIKNYQFCFYKVQLYVLELSISSIFGWNIAHFYLGASSGPPQGVGFFSAVADSSVDFGCYLLFRFCFCLDIFLISILNFI